MPILVMALVGALLRLGGTLVGRVLIALGFQALTITGLTFSLDWATAYVTSHWGGLPATSLQILGALKIGTDIGILSGAVLARMTLRGLEGGAMTMFGMKART
jgi:hypothetical protein